MFKGPYEEVANTINALCRASFAASASKGWHEGCEGRQRDPELLAARVALIHSEVSEALEEIRIGAIDMYDKAGKPEGAVVELADTLIRIFDLAGAAGMDLGGALVAKLAYNETRPHRHGGKRL